MREAIVNATEIGFAETLPYSLRGVPPNIFKPDTFGEVTGLSGRSRLDYSVSKTKITIRDTKRRNFLFEMEYDPEEMEISVVAKTVGIIDGVSIKHPDLYASDLITHSLAFFESQGLGVKAWKLSWVPDEEMNVNLSAFTRALNLDMEEYLSKDDGGQSFLEKLKSQPEDVKRAIFQTWSGKLAYQLGFTEVAVTDGSYIKLIPGTGIVIRLIRTSKFLYVENDKRQINPWLKRLVYSVFDKRKIFS